MNDQTLTFEQLTGFLYILHCNIATTSTASTNTTDTKYDQNKYKSFVSVKFRYNFI